MNNNDCEPLILGIEQDTNNAVSFKYIYSCSLCNKKDCKNNISEATK